MTAHLLPLLVWGLLTSCTAAATTDGAAAVAPASSKTARTQEARDGTEDSGLTIEESMTLGRRLRASGGPRGWLDGEHYLVAQPAAGTGAEGEEPGPARLHAVHARTGEARELFDADAMAAAFSSLPGVAEADARRWSARTRFDFTDDHDGVLLDEHGDLFFWQLGAERAARLTHDPAPEVGAVLSPDGSLVAYIHDWNLHVVPTAGGTPLALTSDGDEDVLYGRLDWVYQEEIYGRGNWNGFWWSPDSRKLAFLILEEREVPAFTIVDHREIHPEVEVWRYPKAGDPNPKVRLAVVDAAGGDPVELDLSAWIHEDPLVVRVGWTPDGRSVVLQIQDRTQTWLDLCLGDPKTGEVTRLFRDSTGVWYEPNESPTWLPDGERFLWRSERDGYAHLYLYGRDGQLVRRLTQGPWEVDAVYGVDEAGQAWFASDKDGVKGRQLYRVSVDGGAPVRVTQGGGTHRTSVSPTQAYFVDAWSSASDPGHVAVHDASGARIRMLGEADQAPIAEHGLVTPEFFTVPTEDGFEMEAMRLAPPDFDPARKWPVLISVYGGPHAPQVRDAWTKFNTDWHQVLAQDGYVVFVLDNRSASGKGLASVREVYREFGKLELADLEDGLDWLEAQGWADMGRIGIWGWSFGGYLTSYALTHSERFAVGIAGAPVTDWHLYDSIYTERYMGTPQENPEGYAASSVLEAAENLSGKLLLIHGTIDENVHVQNSIMLSERLQKAGKQYELMLYPGNRHPILDPGQKLHLHTMMAEFVRANL